MIFKVKFYASYRNESDRKMFYYFERSDQRYEQLQEEVNSQIKEYQKTLEEDLRVEKTNRTMKAKLTQQLQLLLNKYDKDAGEKTNELNDLADTMRDRQEEFDEWKRTVFDPQEKKYCHVIGKVVRADIIEIILLVDTSTPSKNAGWTS